MTDLEEAKKVIMEVLSKLRGAGPRYIVHELSERDTGKMFNKAFKALVSERSITYNKYDYKHPERVEITAEGRKRYELRYNKIPDYIPQEPNMAGMTRPVHIYNSAGQHVDTIPPTSKKSANKTFWIGCIGTIIISAGLILVFVLMTG